MSKEDLTEKIRRALDEGRPGVKFIPDEYARGDLVAFQDVSFKPRASVGPVFKIGIIVDSKPPGGRGDATVWCDNRVRRMWKGLLVKL